MIALLRRRPYTIGWLLVIAGLSGTAWLGGCGDDPAMYAGANVGAQVRPPVATTTVPTAALETVAAGLLPVCDETVPYDQPCVSP